MKSSRQAPTNLSQTLCARRKMSNGAYLSCQTLQTSQKTCVATDQGKLLEQLDSELREANAEYRDAVAEARKFLLTRHTVRAARLRR